jgi:DNA polymerase III delta subunit
MDVRVCWITGGTVLRRRAIDKILSQCGDHVSYTFDEEATAEFVYSKLNSVDIFSLMDSEEKEVYILKHLPSFDGSTKSSNKKLTEMIKSLQPNQLLIISGVEHKNNKTVAAAVKEAGKFIELADKLSKKDAITFLGIEFDKIGKEIDSSDIKFLTEFVGTGDSQKFSSDYLCNIVYKFKYYLGKKKSISREDIERVCRIDRKSVVWDLMDRLDSKDFNGAMSAFENMVKSNRDLKATIESIVYPMMWKYRLLIYIKELQREGLNYNQVLEKVALLVKNNEDKSRIYSDGFVRRIMQGFYGAPPIINLYSRNNLYKIYKAMTFHMTNMRFYTESESKLMVTILFLVICDEIDFKCLKDINEFFLCNKVCNTL